MDVRIPDLVNSIMATDISKGKIDTQRRRYLLYYFT
jgi:hypothetical protein